MADNNFVIRASLDFDSDVNKIFSEKLKPRLDELEKLSNIKLKLDAGNIDDFQQSVEKIKNQFNEIQKVSNQQIKVNKIDTSGLVKPVDELKNKLDGLKNKYKDVFEQSKGIQINSQLNALNPAKDLGEIEKTADKIKKLEVELKELRRVSNLGENLKIIPKDSFNDVEKLTQKIKELYGESVKIKSITEPKSDGMGNQFRKLKIETQDAEGQIKNLGITVDKTTSSIYKNNEAVKQSSSNMSSFGNSLKSSFQQLMAFAGITSVMFAVVGATKQGIKSILELDSAMIELKKVSNETDETYNKFLVSVNKTAIEVGHSTKAAIESTAEFKKLGYSMKEAEELAKNALIYSNVGDMPIDKATKSLISTMKGFKVEAKDSIQILDKFNEVGNNFSIGSDTIGESLLRSASALGAANNSLDQSIGLITAAHATVQDDGEKTGTALKTLSIRLRGVDEESGKLIPHIRENIKKITDVDIMKDENTFKSTFEIMKEMAKVYPTLTDKQRAYVAELAAGKMHANSFQSIMQNYKEMEKATESSTKSSGSAMREQEQYMNSIKAKMNELKETSVGFWNSLISSEAIKGLVSMGTGAIKLLDGLTKTFGGLPVIVGAATMALLTFNKGIKDLFSGVGSGGSKIEGKFKTIGIELGNIKERVRDMSTVGPIMQNIGTETAKTTTIFGSLKNIMKAVGLEAMLMNVLITGGISIIVAGLAKLISSAKEAKKSLTEALTEAPAKNQELMTQKSQVRALEQLSAKKNRTKEEDLKLLEVQKELAKIFPQVADGFDSEGNAIVTNTKLVKEQMDEKRKLAKLENEDLATKAKDELPKLEAKAKAEADKLARLKKQVADFGKTVPKTSVGADKETMNQINTYNSLKTSLDKTTASYKNTLGEVSKFKGAMNSLSQVNQQEIKDIMSQNKAFQDGKMSTSEMTEALKSQGYEQKDIAAAIEEHTKSTDKNSDSKKINTGAINDNKEALEESTNAFKAASGEIDFLNEVIKDYNENGNLSAQNIGTMAEKYPQYLQYLNDETTFIDNITKARDTSTQMQSAMYDDLLAKGTKMYSNENDMANESANNRINASANATEGNAQNYNTDGSNFSGTESNKKNDASDTENHVTNSTANATDTNSGNYNADGSNFSGNEGDKRDMADTTQSVVVDSSANMVDGCNINYNADVSNFADAQNAKIDIAVAAGASIASALSSAVAGVGSLMTPELQSLLNSAPSENAVQPRGGGGGHVGVRNGGGSGGKGGSKKGTGSGSKSGGSGKGTGGSSSSGSGSKEKDVENLELEYDRYKKINDELSQYDYWINKISSDKESAKTDGEKVKLLSQEVEWLNKKKAKLEELRKEQESEEKGLAWDLTQNGFDIKWTEDMDGQWSVIISNMNERLEQLVSSANSLTGKAKEDAIKKVKELEEEVKKYSDLTVNKMADSSKAWQDNAKAISDTNKEMEDLVKNKMKDYIEKQKEADYMEQEEKHKKENIELEKSIYEVSKEQFEAYKTSKINGINEEITKLHDKLLVDAENVDTQDALKAKFEELKMVQDEQFDKIKNYQEVYEKTYKERMENIDKEIKILDDKYEAEQKAEEEAENRAKEEEERKNRLKDIADSQKEINELEKQLINLKKEKNIRTLTKDSEGKFQWDWTHNQQEYEKVQEDINNKEDDLKKKHQEMAKWEQDLIKQKEKKKKEEEHKAQRDKLENEKKYLEEVLRIQQQKYEQQKKTLEAKQQAEKDLLDAHYKDVEALTDKWLNELKQIYGENWSQMSIIVDEKVTTMEKRIKEMIDAINLANQAVAGLGSGSSGITSGMINVGGKVLTSEERYLTDNPDVKAMLQSGNAPFKSGRQHWELWGKDEGREWKDASLRPAFDTPKIIDFGGNQIGRGVMPPSFGQAPYSAPTLHQNKGDSININGDIILPSVKKGSDFASELQGFSQQAKQRFM